MVLTNAGRDLLRASVRALDDAYQAESPAERYVAANVAALRAGAALLAVHARPSRSGRIRSVWQTVRTVAPELGEWCAYFELIGGRRTFVEIGQDPISQRQADDLVRDAERFIDQVAAILGVGLPVPVSDPCMRPTG